MACADWLLPPPNFLSVWTSSPERRAALTSDALFEALPFGPLLVQTTGAQSCAPCNEGPLGIVCPLLRSLKAWGAHAR
eukprot:CAMPEP_0179084610 /NCGR_PEP_ID=MMETSP0796-20121207/38273_1 /TAXON_ID=73915 /ORGANISM="Pyrodinium bahamense, Strain pbaha01" /LENGTH=77 /DNA_ID=CAMNT_0020782035 /DNA_START=478 /DNA_END=711 /DNA_ORIENTATION=+